MQLPNSSDEIQHQSMIVRYTMVRPGHKMKLCDFKRWKLWLRCLRNKIYNDWLYFKQLRCIYLSNYHLSDCVLGKRGHGIENNSYPLTRFEGVAD